MRRLLLALVLMLPSAAAGTPFVVDHEDARDDVVGMMGTHVSVPNADILRISSNVSNGTVFQRVELAARAAAPDDSIFVRNWYADSENGSWHVIDLEVDGNSPEVSQRFKPLRREGAFENVTVIDARYGIEGTSWVFSFNESLVADAKCFDMGAFSDHSPPPRTRKPQGFDEAYLPQRQCVTRLEPGGDAVPPPIVVGVPSPKEVTQAPGSEAPTPGAGVWGALAALGLAAARMRRAS